MDIVGFVVSFEPFVEEIEAFGSVLVAFEEGKEVLAIEGRPALDAEAEGGECCLAFSGRKEAQGGLDELKDLEPAGVIGRRDATQEQDAADDLEEEFSEGFTEVVGVSVKAGRDKGFAERL